MKEIDILAKSLSYETLETAALYLDESGASSTIEWAVELIAGHFKTLLNSRLNSDFSAVKLLLQKKRGRYSQSSPD